MKESIVSTLEIMLYIYIALMTVLGYAIGGTLGGLSSGLFGEPGFNMGSAFIGALAGLFLSLVGTGAIFTLIRIKELLEVQVHYLQVREADRR